MHRGRCAALDADSLTRVAVDTTSEALSDFFAEVDVLLREHLTPEAKGLTCRSVGGLEARSCAA